MSAASLLRAYRLSVLGLFVAIAILHALGFLYSLYYYWWWYDIPMHILGGFAVALLSADFFFLQRRDNGEHTAKRILITILISVLAAGIIWEIFEFGIDKMFKLLGNDAIDTAADFGNDLIGALLGAWAFLIFRRKMSKKKEAVEARILL